MDPLTVIGYLQPEYQGGFRFSLGSRVESLGPGVREIDLLPVARRGTTGKPARVWVSESSGEVLRTELRSGFGSRAEITTTTFDTDPALGIRVPTTMRDDVPGRNEDFVGTATYRNFRRFAVQTESVVDVPTTNP